jgi:hypothetical protein
MCYTRDLSNEDDAERRESICSLRSMADTVVGSNEAMPGGSGELKTKNPRLLRGLSFGSSFQMDSDGCAQRPGDKKPKHILKWSSFQEKLAHAQEIDDTSDVDESHQENTACAKEDKKPVPSQNKGWWLLRKARSVMRARDLHANYEGMSSIDGRMLWNMSGAVDMF